jgi:hypothetical protein
MTNQYSPDLIGDKNMMNFAGSIHYKVVVEKNVDVCCGVYFGCLSRVAVWLYYFLTRPLASDHDLWIWPGEST